MSEQYMCPICTKQISEGEVTMKYRIWGGDRIDAWAHARCVMILATPDEKGSKPAS
jgi:hypothetical protein